MALAVMQYKFTDEIAFSCLFVTTLHESSTRLSFEISLGTAVPQGISNQIVSYNRLHWVYSPKDFLIWPQYS